MDHDSYTNKLVETLVNPDKWPQLVMSDEFNELAKEVNKDVGSGTTSAKIASIFVKHQLIHEMTKSLISMCNLYVQGEIWPTVYKPAVDKNQDQMTGWYLSYFRDSCVYLDGKDNFLSVAFELNRLRNKVAHNLTGKNGVVISETHSRFSSNFEKAVSNFVTCEQDILWRLKDLTNRVDFEEFANH
ncbi:hypothetical protein B7Y94_03510 [Candidatus Saccharibacteria bacterium 32-49-12]|nr:MAG: hypothetical protein B7Y94_03510 [Candidatus Saccharibacteria bacterium 32-49-12]